MYLFQNAIRKVAIQVCICGDVSKTARLYNFHCASHTHYPIFVYTPKLNGFIAVIFAVYRISAPYDQRVPRPIFKSMDDGGRSMVHDSFEQQERSQGSMNKSL